MAIGFQAKNSRQANIKTSNNLSAHWLGWYMYKKDRPAGNTEGYQNCTSWCVSVMAAAAKGSRKK